MSDAVIRKNVLIIAEGYEEKPYIDKILSFPNIKKDVYCFAETVNVKGNGNIPARYQFELQRNFFDIILIFCDADNGSDQFLKLVDEIGERFFTSKSDGKKVFIFANPVTLQIVLSHFGDVCLTRTSKKINAIEVERLTKIKDYDAKQEQIKEMIDNIHFATIESFKERLRSISSDFNDVPSTNFLEFLERFENNDNSWIDDINKLRK